MINDLQTQGPLLGGLSAYSKMVDCKVSVDNSAYCEDVEDVDIFIDLRRMKYVSECLGERRIGIWRFPGAEKVEHGELLPRRI